MTMSAEAPIGQPPLYVLAGSLLPFLPPGIDTLVASNDPSTVSLSAMAGKDVANGWVSGPASATCLDGSTLTVADDASGVQVTWSPAGTGNAMTVGLDLSQRTGGTTLPTQVVSVSGTTPVAETSVSAVASATGSAYYLSGSQVFLRLMGGASVRIH
jgi:hypothetical protein